MESEQSLRLKADRWNQLLDLLRQAGITADTPQAIATLVAAEQRRQRLEPDRYDPGLPVALDLDNTDD